MAKVIAVDFDGTLCEEAWPGIGAPLLENIRRVKKAKQDGDKIILWTCREGEKLREALEWCAAQGLYFDTVNRNTQENTECFGADCRKVYACEYWDDRAVYTSANTAWRRNLLERAIAEYGIVPQVDIAIEEMSELTKALLKYRRALCFANCDEAGIAEMERCRDNILEEMADVQITLDQLRLIYGECANEEREKLMRLERRLNKEDTV